MVITEDAVRDALRDVIDPELGINIVDLGLVYRVEIENSTVRVVMTVTSPACPLGDYLRDLVDQKLHWRIPDVHDVQIELVREPPWHPEMMTALAHEQLYAALLPVSGRARGRVSVAVPRKWPRDLAGADHPRLTFMASHGALRATPRPAGRLVVRRLPLMAIAILSMACGTWLGLVRIGWTLPLPGPSEIAAHGPLMVCGFLGTLIAVERAVALRSPWAYIAPALVAAGALSLDLPVGPFGPFLIAAGSTVLVAVFAVLVRRQPALYMTTMAAGAVAWAIGNALWLGGAPVFRVVYWWVAFLVLTIAGERLELNRVLQPTPGIRAAFRTAVGLVLGGVVVSARLPGAGAHALGAGFFVLAVWLTLHDVARRTVRQHGLTRYMAVCLLAGYAWLGFAGLVALATGVATPGLVYDAMLHAIFLGFVMSMVFAHAPVIFPAVLGRPLPFHSRFYVHAVVLHASVLVRVMGDLVGGLVSWRAWGGLLNALALLVFIANIGGSIMKGAHHGRQ